MRGHSSWGWGRYRRGITLVPVTSIVGQQHVGENPQGHQAQHHTDNNHLPRFQGQNMDAQQGVVAAIGERGIIGGPFVGVQSRGQFQGTPWGTARSVRTRCTRGGRHPGASSSAPLPVRQTGRGQQPGTAHSRARAGHPRTPRPARDRPLRPKAQEPGTQSLGAAPGGNAASAVVRAEHSG